MICWRYKFSEIIIRPADSCADFCTLGVTPGQIDRALVAIAAENQVGRQFASCLFGLFEQLFPGRGFEVGPALKTEVGREQARGGVAGEQRGFKRQASRTAHRVDKMGFLVPARQGDKAGGERFFERRNGRIAAVATSMQAGPCQIEADGAVIPGQVQIDPQVGILRVNVGTFSAVVPDFVNDGVLGFQGGEAGVSDLGIAQVGIHGQGHARSQKLLPIEGIDTFVKSLLRWAGETGDRLQNPVGRP